MTQHPPEDAYSRVDYRRLIAWPERIAREAPWLRRLLAEAPAAAVLDLGCGTGEHVAFLAGEASAGLHCRAVGIDSSESMIAKARDHEAAGHGRFLLGDAMEARAVLGGEPPFGLVLCLGNMLPHLADESQLDRLLEAAHGSLLPGGSLLVQLLNYRRILDQGVRHLPLNFRTGESGEQIVFVRLMQPQADGTVLFFPTTLRLDPDAEEPVSVASTRRVVLRAWLREQLAAACQRTGFTPRWFGGMEGEPYLEQGSQDLVMLARRE